MKKYTLIALAGLILSGSTAFGMGCKGDPGNKGPQTPVQQRTNKNTPKTPGIYRTLPNTYPRREVPTDEPRRHVNGGNSHIVPNDRAQRSLDYGKNS
ncbi:hypothetical protein KKA53_03740 [Candidatus Dependentiae bacterium]|nr:hypothetical protein [Candidatus Dependentiae bacterium]